MHHISHLLIIIHAAAADHNIGVGVVMAGDILSCGLFPLFNIEQSMYLSEHKAGVNTNNQAFDL